MIHAAATQASGRTTNKRWRGESPCQLKTGSRGWCYKAGPKACTSRDRREKCLSRSVLKDFGCYGILSLHWHRSRPGGSVGNLETFRRWEVGSNLGAVTGTGIFPPNKWRKINSLVHKIRLHGRRGKGTAESFSREKLRQAPQKEGGEILCDLCLV